MIETLRYTPAKLTRYALLLSLYTLIAYHLPLFRVVVESIDKGFNGWLIAISFALLMVVANFMTYSIILYLGRIVGKIVLAISFIGNAIALYFINTYEVLITDMMMGNVFNTRFSEASSFFSLSAVAYVALLGLPPVVYIFWRKVDYGKIKRLGLSVGISLAAILLIALCNMQNTLWIDRNATQIGSLIMPWSYVVNSIRYHNLQQRLNREEIPLPDATITNSNRDVVVLVIGESARRANFSLYGYERDTNPWLSQDDITAYPATASATYTTAGVKAILDHKPTDELYEILPNYLARTGVEVVWRTTNWGEPPLHLDHYYDQHALKAMYPDADERYDGILLEGLSEVIASSTADKLLIVLHLSTSHGPTYFKKYPAEFEHFTPVCTKVEVSEEDNDELINAYDNSIRYTDYLLHSVIELLSGVESRRAAMLFISDHGESLGEGGLYMHGMPMAVAPEVQYEIPFVVWEAADDISTREVESAGHYHIFHSVLSFFGIESAIYDESMSVFTTNE